MPINYMYFEHLPLLNNKYVQEAKSSEYTSQWKVGDKEITVNTKQAHTSFENTKFMKDLTAKFGSTRCHYIKTDPMTCYDWHVDSARDCGIIFLLNEVTDAVTLYRMEIPGVNYNIEPLKGVSYNIERVIYPLRRLVLINTKTPHSLVNFSNEARYVLTVGFNNGILFDDVANFLNTYTTNQY